MSENYVRNKNKITARRWYTDIDLNITPHPSSGDLVLKQDKEAVKRSVRNIMSVSYTHLTLPTTVSV